MTRHDISVKPAGDAADEWTVTCTCGHSATAPDKAAATRVGATHLVDNTAVDVDTRHPDLFRVDKALEPEDVTVRLDGPQDALEIQIVIRETGGFVDLVVPLDAAHARTLGTQLGIVADIAEGRPGIA